MNMSVTLSPLSQLAQVLQADVQQRLSGEEVQVRCAVRPIASQPVVLMVLADHAACAIADPDEAIAQIIAAIQAVEPALIRQAQATPDFDHPVEPAATPRPVTFATRVPIQIYLRLEGQSRPYQTQRYFWTAPSPRSQSDPAIAATVEFFTPADVASPDTDDVGSDPNAATPLTPATAALMDAALMDMDEVDFTALTIHGAEPAAFADDDVEELELDDDWVWELPYLGPVRLHRWMAIAAGGVVSVAAFSGALYGLTRPCVLGGCPELIQAERLSQAALAQLTATPTAPTVQMAHSDIQAAEAILQAIPPWSRHHGAAIALRQSYQTQAAELDQVRLAQAEATQAVNVTQSPPHPIRVWQTARTHWETAIAHLADLPTDSDLAPFIQQKQAEYVANLTTVNDRIQAEEMATQALELATQVAQQAEAQQLTADSVTTWQQTVDRWRSAVNTLRRIPQGTLAYTEAMTLLGVYDAQLNQAQQQATQENIAQQAYTQATTAATSARQFEQQEQWTLAVAAWRDALLNMRQVPTASVYGENVSGLVATYQDSLGRAESQLEAAVARQQTQQDLAQTCAGNPTICTYTIAAGFIQVHLTTAYDRSVEQAMLTASANQDQLTQVRIAEHVNTLLQALVTVGNNAGMPIELFDSQGNSLGRYDPRATAYVPR